MNANALAKTGITAGGAVAAIVPHDIDQAYRLAQAIAISGMAPKSYGTDANKIMVGIMHGMELGLTPMAALSSIAVINNQPAVWGDGMLALVRASGLLERFVETVEGEGDAMVATCTLKRAGEDETTRTFSMADAKTAGLKGKSGPWQSYPKRMLAMRARSWALRDTFADVLRGLRMAEEVMDAIPLVEQAGGSYAPEPPKREDFTPPSYPVVTADGEVIEVAATGAGFVTALRGAVDHAISEQDDVRPLWEANQDTLDRVRLEQPQTDTGTLYETWHAWCASQEEDRGARLKAEFDRIIAALQSASNIAALAQVWKDEQGAINDLRKTDERLSAMIESEKEALKAKLTGKEAA